MVAIGSAWATTPAAGTVRGVSPVRLHTILERGNGQCYNARDVDPETAATAKDMGLQPHRLCCAYSEGESMMRSAWITLSLVISGSILARAWIGRTPAQEVPVTKCDVYAASDQNSNINSRMFHTTRSILPVAVPACEDAVRQYPNNNRLIFQLEAAYSKNNNLNLAASQFRKAAEQGYPAAEYNLGVMYKRGVWLSRKRKLWQ